MRKWLIGGGIALAVLLAALGTAGWMASRRFEPYIREQALQYLESRFGPGVKLGALHVHVTFLSPWHPRAARLRVSGDGLELPLIAVGKFRMDTELGSLWDSPRRIREVRLEQLRIDVPPRERRPHLAGGGGADSPAPAVSVDRIQVDGAELRIFPSDAAKLPRVFEIHALTFTGQGPGQPFAYEAQLTNPTPPGTVRVSGSFGPWQKDDPGLTAISGEYTFSNADLSVFHAIAGTLDSTGKFQGVLRRIEVHGETRTPRFRLAGGNIVPLTTRFDSIVDGTSGDTELKPVRATLGSTPIEARGRIIRPQGAKARSVELDVVLRNGKVEDLLRLAVKSPDPFLHGDVDLRTKMQILPVPGRVMDERLLLEGSFYMDRSRFTGASLQQKIDSLSRRAQGQPNNEAIADVFSSMRGGFTLRDGDLQFSELVFQIPGAAIHLHGGYGLDSEEIDLHGIVRLQAKASETMTGWKRIVLKPIDPLLSKSGAGVLLPIRIGGTRSSPQFGLEFGRKKDGAADRRAAAR
jgi:hypothetical protein